LVLALLAAAGAAVVYLFNPAEHGFYPVCYFNLMTGLYCPGCGAMRAMHQLLHGNVVEAARLNLLLLITLAALAWSGVRFAVNRRHGQPWRIPPSWVWGYLALSTVFALLRNLPEFRWLAP
jgi:hypothetical protein